MTNDEMANCIRAWHDGMAELERQTDAFSALTGAPPDSPLMESFWTIAGNYTAAADQLVGGRGWLPWYWLECNLGARPLEAGVGSHVRRIASCDDLIWLVMEDRA
jgi:hypothetical protein